MAGTRDLLLPCLRGVIGDWVYYSTVMTADEITAYIRPARELREAKALEDFLQRDLQQRVVKIGNYLLREPSHFFPSMVVGVFGGIPEWYAFDLVNSPIAGQAISGAEATRLSESIGLLRMTGNEEMFAIDGQHRVEAIKTAWATAQARQGGIPELRDDQFSLILVAHGDDETGRKRSRRLFADINKRAVPVSPGDLAIIDEEEVAIISARRIYAKYTPFKDRISLTQQGNLDADDTDHIANLLTLVQVNKKLKKLYRKARGTREWEEVNVSAMFKVATTFYDFLLDAVPPLAGCLNENKPNIGTLRTKHRHLVARPVGLVLLAQLYVLFALRDSLPELKTKLSLLDMDLSGRHFNNVLWSGGKMEPRNRAVALSLCLYLFGVDGVDVEEVRRDYRRVVKDNQAELPPQL